MPMGFFEFNILNSLGFWDFYLRPTTYLTVFHFFFPLYIVFTIQMTNLLKIQRICSFYEKVFLMEFYILFIN